LYNAVRDEVLFDPWGPLFTLSMAPMETVYDYLHALHVLKLANDPPDPNYTEIALPVLRNPPAAPSTSLSPSTMALFTKRLASKAMLQAYLEAMQISDDRYITALGAGDLASADRQRDAILGYADALRLLFEADAQVTDGLLTSLQAEGA